MYNLHWTDITVLQGPPFFHGTEHLEIIERKVRTVRRVFRNLPLEYFQEVLRDTPYLQSWPCAVWFPRVKSHESKEALCETAISVQWRLDARMFIACWTEIFRKRTWKNSCHVTINVWINLMIMWTSRPLIVLSNN